MNVFTVQYIFDCTGKGVPERVAKNGVAKERTSTDKRGHDRTSADIPLQPNDLEKQDEWDQN